MIICKRVRITQTKTFGSKKKLSITGMNEQITIPLQKKIEGFGRSLLQGVM